jgi:hypothetical protein
MCYSSGEGNLAEQHMKSDRKGMNRGKDHLQAHVLILFPVSSLKYSSLPRHSNIKLLQSLYRVDFV